MTTSETALLQNTPSPREDFPDELAERFLQIAGLEENWNGYGAPPMEPDCIEDAIRIVKMGLAMGLPAPSVAPGGDAGVGIEWAAGQWELSIDITPDGETTYALDHILSDGSTEESEGAFENDGQIRRILGR